MEKRITLKQIYMLFLQSCLVILEEILRSLGKDELTALELFQVVTNTYGKNKRHISFRNKTASEFKKMSAEGQPK